MGGNSAVHALHSLFILSFLNQILISYHSLIIINVWFIRFNGKNVTDESYEAFDRMEGALYGAIELGERKLKE